MGHIFCPLAPQSKLFAGAVEVALGSAVAVVVAGADVVVAGGRAVVVGAALVGAALPLLSSQPASAAPSAITATIHLESLVNNAISLSGPRAA
jgi:hypothetical protein